MLQVDRPARTQAWNTLYASQLPMARFTPFDRAPLDAQMAVARLGPIKLARLSFDSCVIERTRGHIDRSTSRRFAFVIQTAGTSRFYHYGVANVMQPGDVVLCNSAMQHYWLSRGLSSAVLVEVEPRLLREFLPTPEQYCGKALGADQGVTRAMTSLVQSLAEPEALAVIGDHGDRVGRHMLGALLLQQ